MTSAGAWAIDAAGEGRNSRPFVSVAVCTRNRAAGLEQTVRSILACRYEPFELLVLDQGEDDAEARIAAFDDQRIRYFRLDSRGLSRSRNAALLLAESEIVLFTDDDCLADRDWIAATAEAFERVADAAVVYGTLQPVAHDTALGIVPQFVPRRARAMRGPLATLRTSGYGGNMAVRRSVVLALGGFDELLGAGSRFPSSEDSEIARRVLRSRYAVVETPRSIVLHDGLRPYADGSGQRLIRNALLADGARHARDVRCGHLLALAEAAHIASIQARMLAGRLITTGRPTGAGRLAAYLRGFWAGLRHPIDRAAGVFIDEGTNAAAEA